MRAGGVLEDAAPLANAREGRREAAAVIPGAVVLAAVALEVDAGHVRPQLAGWVGDDGVRPGVEASVATRGPGVDVGEAEVAASLGHEEGGDHRALAFARASHPAISRETVRR